MYKKQKKKKQKGHVDNSVSSIFLFLYLFDQIVCIDFFLFIHDNPTKILIIQL